MFSRTLLRASAVVCAYSAMGQAQSTVDPGSEAFKQEVAKAVETYLTKKVEKKDPRWDRLSIYGDFRLRHESNIKLDAAPDRHRGRLRFRLGATYQANDEFQFGARITTGDPADPNGPHQTLGNGFHNFGVNLDRAFLTYRPKWAPGVWATGGKFAHPFFANPVYGELVWDADVQPEGLAGGYTTQGKGTFERFGLVAAKYNAIEQSRTPQAFASALQASTRLRLGDHMKLDLALGYLRFGNTTPSGSKTLLNDNGGNATVDTNGDGKPDLFLSDFKILNPIAALTYDGWNQPLVLSGETIKNQGAKIDQDRGWAAGVSFGKAKKQGDWRIYYQRQVVEKDAVFSPVAQDDFLFQTNHKSHLVGAEFQVKDNLGLHLFGLISARDLVSTAPGSTSDQSQWRLRFDVNLRF